VTIGTDPNAAREAKQQSKQHSQERMRVIQIMAPKSYEFDHEFRTGFELEVGFSNRNVGEQPIVRFESVDAAFKELPAQICRQDLMPNLGKPFFFVRQVEQTGSDTRNHHPYLPEVETFVPAGMAAIYRNMYDTFKYQPCIIPRDGATPQSTVMDVMALEVFHNRTNIDWLFSPDVKADELAKRLGFNGGQKDPAYQGEWSGILDSVERALRSRHPRDSSRSMMHRASDCVNYMYSEHLLPADPHVRQLLRLPISTLRNYVEGF